MYQYIISIGSLKGTYIRFDDGKARKIQRSINITYVLSKIDDESYDFIHSVVEAPYFKAFPKGRRIARMI